MKHPEIYKINDGLHKLGKNPPGNQRLIVLQRFLGVYDGIINTNVKRTLRKLSIKMFQECSHLTFSERFCAIRV